MRREIDPDEIFLDSKNLAGFDEHQFEGRIEKPISIASILGLSGAFALVMIILLGKAWTLQAKDGETYAAISADNSIAETTVFAERGAVFDRNGARLAWNAELEGADFSARAYIDQGGFGHLLGYVKYPAKDKSGFYYRKNFEGMAGVEKTFNDALQGQHGSRIVQTDALGKLDSEVMVRPAKDGDNLTLSIDAGVQAKLYSAIKGLSERVGFRGGGGVIMDVETGEVIALTSYPEYSSATMSDGTDAKTIKGYLESEAKPFLNRPLSGAYTPGSIVKPFVALAALEEGTISPDKQIHWSGSISVPNPYDPTKKTVFMDWKAHGSVDMRKAIAVSSNVYFYAVGGGFESQKGVGIERLGKYFSMFGFGKKLADGYFAGPAGTVPSVSWKERVFPGDDWRIGDTYFTSIGQYGWQVTQLQIVRAIGALANGGFYLDPAILRASTSSAPSGSWIDVDPDNLQIVREGMRQGATTGTASGLNVPYVKVAAKTGTAELGVSKAFVNSWVTGFFPYNKPRYAFAVMMEHGPRANIYGATSVMRELLDWMHLNDSPYLKE